jgi:uncharacterized Zn-finger protein
MSKEEKKRRDTETRKKPKVLLPAEIQMLKVAYAKSRYGHIKDLIATIEYMQEEFERQLHPRVVIFDPESEEPCPFCGRVKE